MPVRFLSRTPFEGYAYPAAEANPLRSVFVPSETLRQVRKAALFLHSFGLTSFVIGGSFSGFQMFMGGKRANGFLPADVDIYLPLSVLDHLDVQSLPMSYHDDEAGVLPTDFIFHPDVRTTGDALRRVSGFALNFEQTAFVVQFASLKSKSATIRAFATPPALEFHQSRVCKIWTPRMIRSPPGVRLLLLERLRRKQFRLRRWTLSKPLTPHQVPRRRQFQ